MASTTAYPPTSILPNSSKPIPLAAAQTLLSTYLSRSETNPYLHPDALLQPSGPTFSVQGGPQGGLVLQQLHRVEAGLRGEILKPEPKLREKEGNDEKLDGLIADTEARIGEGLDETPARRKGGLKRKAEDLNVGVGPDDLLDGEDNLEEVAEQMIDSDDEVNVAEGAETGELGDRSNFVEDAGEIPEVHTVPKSKAEKDAKKAAKKERNKQSKILREKQRQEAKTGASAVDGTTVVAPTTTEQTKKDKKRKKRQEAENE